MMRTYKIVVVFLVLSAIGGMDAMEKKDGNSPAGVSFWQVVAVAGGSVIVNWVGPVCWNFLSNKLSGTPVTSQNNINTVLSPTEQEIDYIVLNMVKDGKFTPESAVKYRELIAEQSNRTYTLDNYKSLLGCIKKQEDPDFDHFNGCLEPMNRVAAKKIVKKDNPSENNDDQK